MALIDTHPVTIDSLIAEEEAQFLARIPQSLARADEASEVLAGGATSNWMISRPAAVWVSHGQGSKVWDVDGMEYVDLHGGYGVMVAGHANPAIVEAVQRRVTQGTHFAQPTDDSIVVARHLAERFGLPLWRFNNSGTEATMDAVHLMRAFTGREQIVKIEGSYHGHHDAVMVSQWRSLDMLGPADNPHRVASAGIPQAMAELVHLVPFNDLAALERVLHTHSGSIAGMIMEPMMMNAGIIPPDPGYLQGVRELTRKYGVLLAFDEVKTGLSVHRGGVTGLFGVTPDIVCLAKVLGGGVPCGAIGGTTEVMSAIADGRYDQVGTFNGNPLTMAAARAMLTEVLTDDAYRQAGARSQAMFDRSMDALRRHGVPCYGFAFGFKGSLVFNDRPARNCRDFLAMDTGLSHLHFLVQHNGGVFMAPWGKSEQWTISPLHTDADVDRFCGNVERFAALVGSTADGHSHEYAAGGYY
ncbi:MAG: glutamate-semialdehyde -aminomutase [Ilumatobacteraceae bacterium]|jgi:glutamate-1-semialdehyde 2,1-aminomutase|nr:glutamate-semialdehyde -aminomutase [Ilumatobacteraceae bacterium]